jgi:predicted metalloendopeptidase
MKPLKISALFATAALTASVRNIDSWYDAFDVKPGQLLYLAPKDRVRLW